MADRTSMHNLLSERFVRDVVGSAIKDGASYSDLMVLSETVQLGMMEILNKHYGLAPAVAVGLGEASLQHAIERFSELRKGAR
ncbi:MULTISPECIES: hypothetical protein [Mesorhizobium]|uniref:hypothetical protein n=1 Tax=Mesorhizobium TaxID=68287 RepID=UPI0010A97C8E|nr:MULTISPECIES: hypothetical protein [Mesorhizobium]